MNKGNNNQCAGEKIVFSQKGVFVKIPHNKYVTNKYTQKMKGENDYENHRNH